MTSADSKAKLSVYSCPPTGSVQNSFYDQSSDVHCISYHYKSGLDWRRTSGVVRHLTLYQVKTYSWWLRYWLGLTGFISINYNRINKSIPDFQTTWLTLVEQLQLGNRAYCHDLWAFIKIRERPRLECLTDWPRVTDPYYGSHSRNRQLIVYKV